MDYNQIIFSGHAIRQMFHREIAKEEVIKVVKNGEVIIDYPDDQPYPSRLMLGFIDKKPIHVVFAFDQDTKTGIVVTAYIPDSQLWTDDFKSRR
jgi:hypothetical protein